MAAVEHVGLGVDPVGLRSSVVGDVKAHLSDSSNLTALPLDIHFQSRHIASRARSAAVLPWVYVLATVRPEFQARIADHSIAIATRMCSRPSIALSIAAVRLEWLAASR
jgi:hypothetical protein